MYSFHILTEPSDDYTTLGQLFQEYANSIAVLMCFTSFEKELANIHIQYGTAGNGMGFLIRDKKGKAIGCAGIRRLDTTTAELKRLYVRPDHRGHKLGEQLLLHTIEQAKALGYKKICLDSAKDQMKAAIQLYLKHDFKPIISYNDRTAEDGIIHMERALI